MSTNQLSVSFVDGNEDEHINLGNNVPSPHARHAGPRFSHVQTPNLVVHRRRHHRNPITDWPRQLPPEPTIENALAKFRSLNLHTVAYNIDTASKKAGLRHSEPIQRLQRAVDRNPSILRPSNSLPPIPQQVPLIPINQRGPSLGPPGVRRSPRGPPRNPGPINQRGPSLGHPVVRR